jgi:hypothetical protein
MATTCDYQVIGFDTDRLTIKYTSGERTQTVSLMYDGVENLDAFALRSAPWAFFNEPVPTGDLSDVLGKKGTVTQPEPPPEAPPQPALAAPATPPAPADDGAPAA